MAQRYELYYWPHVQGRGEFVRLALEEAGVPYVDVARLPKNKGGGENAVLRVLREGNGNGGPLPFAVPALKLGDLVVSQTPLILQVIAPRLGLVPKSEAARAHAQEIQLTIADLVAETHDVHHPVASSLYYEDQKKEAKRAAESFIENRIPKFLGWLEGILEGNAESKHQFLVGRTLTYADLSAFQVVEGLRYAFPNAMARIEKKFPLLRALHDRVAKRPRIAKYLASKRRIPFNEYGIFRHYPELDEATPPRAARRAKNVGPRRKRRIASLKGVRSHPSS